MKNNLQKVDQLYTSPHFHLHNRNCRSIYISIPLNLKDLIVLPYHQKIRYHYLSTF
jgi:hypothetical protein